MTDLCASPIASAAIDNSQFRSVLGTVPTGVTVITACDSDGTPVGMTVGTFASVSLDPPLVSFMAIRESTTWGAIRSAGSFCANVLSDEQEQACRTFASKASDKFAGFGWSKASSGAPVLDDVVAWVDCDIETVHAAGDHDIVIGKVRDLQTGVAALPLVFLQGAYGRIGLRSFAAWHEDLLQPLRLADLARSRIERLSTELGRECILTAAVQQELVLLASSGTPSFAGLTRVGQRMPFIPPLGSLFVAWAGPEAENTWRKRLPPGTPADIEDQLSALLERVRTRGFTAGIGRSVHIGAERLLARSFTDQRNAVRASAYEVWETLREGVDPSTLDQSPGREVRSLAVPIFDTSGSVVLSVGVHGLAPSLSRVQIDGFVNALTAAAADISTTLTS